MLEYLGLVGGHIIYIAVGSYVIPDSVQGKKIADEFKSTLSTWIGSATAKSRQN